MSPAKPVRLLLLDIGGVLLTNGWDRHMRRRACEKFGLDQDEMDERHHLTFDTYEEGKLSLEEYLNRTIFYEDRDFTPQAFRDFMFAQSQPLDPEMPFFRGLADRHPSLRVVAVSNEGRELTEHRVRNFRLAEFIEFFVSSCFVHCRKPDHDLFHMALDGTQIPAEEAFYVDDRRMYVEVASGLGIRGIHHTDFEQTKQALADVGLD